MARVISFHYILTDGDGRTLDSSNGGDAFSFMEGARQIIPGLEKEVLGLTPGTKKKIAVAAQEAYGVKQDGLIVTVAKSQLPAGQEIQVGDRFRGGAEEDAPVYTVTEVQGEEVTLDANHPLAGLDLVFDIEITGVREATAEELAHGHAHGPDGHGHHHH